MAFREDADALHARIEGLEKELEDARTELRELRGVAAERDRLRAQLDALQPKKTPKPPPERPRESSPAVRPQSSWAIRIVAALLVVVSISAWYLFGDRVDTRAPSIGMIDLSTTPNPAPVPFVVTGTDDAPSDCAGHLPSAPQLVLRTSAPTLVHITTRCDVDLVAVLTGLPTGLLCDDDGGEGAQPLIETILPAGEARLTIGTYSEDAQASCEIVVSATTLPADVDANGLAVGGAPRLGTVSSAVEPPAPARFVGAIAGQPISAERLDPACRGVVSVVPDLELEVTEPSIARIDAASHDDLVLVVRDADGTFTCDDDSGPGNAPRIARRVPPGRHAVWVGSYATPVVGTPFTVDVQLTPIAVEASRSVASMALDVGTPVHVTGRSGDELSAASLWSTCSNGGFVSLVPTRTFRLAARADVTIDSGRGDLLLAVSRHGEHVTVAPCTTAAEWRAPLEAGAYDLYVGVASGDSAPNAFDVVLAAQPPSVMPYTP